MNRQDVLDAIEMNDSCPGYRYYSVIVRNPGESKYKQYYYTVKVEEDANLEALPAFINFDDLVDLVLADWEDKPFEVVKGLSIGIYHKTSDGVGTFYPKQKGEL